MVVIRGEVGLVEAWMVVVVGASGTSFVEWSCNVLDLVPSLAPKPSASSANSSTTKLTKKLSLFAFFSL
ncbi:unnamed protein product, partial [Ilex paraguariensis]